ncbi:MAG: sugar phosphate isomerase/epimerase [Clostridia bacterium]|nr:sugar phosphate isomerase/epimerase [Clostridia bacterium]
MKTGIQVSSLKPLLKTEAQVYDAFRKMADLGCEAVQVQWVDPAVPIETIAAALRETGLYSVGTQDFYDLVHENTGYYTRLNQLTGGEWLCVSRVPERLKSREGLGSYVGELQTLQKDIAPLGQRLCFHPVAADYAPIDGVVPVEYLLEQMPDLQLCLDLYHLNRCGFNMPEWILAHAGRICMAHFKDGIDGRLTPAGQGSVNWRGVTKACVEAGVAYGFVEQESWDRDPFDCLGEALAWLNKELEA